MRKHTYRCLGILLSSVMILTSGCSAKETTYTSAAEETQSTVTETRETQHIIIETEPIKETTAAQETTPESLVEPEIPQIDTTVMQDQLHVDIQYIYESKWEEAKPIFNGKVAQIYILGDMYPALQRALFQKNQENQEDLTRLYEEESSYAEEMMGFYEDFPGFEFERTAVVTRADEKILSLLLNEYSWLGGAHPNTYLTGCNYDPVTGEKLQLKDVTEDYDAIYEYVLEILEKQQEEFGYFPDYKETVRSLFYEESAQFGELQWNMDTNGVNIYFNPYDIAPYAAGRFTIELPFSEHKDLFREEYVYTGESYAKSVMPYIDYAVDLDGDHADEKLFLMEETSEEFYGSRLLIDAGQVSVEVPLMGYYAQSYLLHTKDSRSYLYVESSGDNDYSFLEIFELQKDAVIPKGQYQAGSLYGHAILDPENFLLYTRLDVLGTYHAYCSYHLGEDGLPVKDEEVYELVNYQTGNDYVITSVVDLPVEIHKKNGDSVSKEEGMMPAGTRFHLRRTDGRSFVEAQLDDGRTCTINYEVVNYETLINGINEFDCFEMLFYAG